MTQKTEKHYTEERLPKVPFFSATNVRVFFLASKRLSLPTNHLPRFLNNPFGIANEAELSSVFCVTHLSHGFSG